MTDYVKINKKRHKQKKKRKKKQTNKLEKKGRFLLAGCFWLCDV